MHPRQLATLDQPCQCTVHRADGRLGPLFGDWIRAERIDDHDHVLEVAELIEERLVPLHEGPIRADQRVRVGVQGHMQRSQPAADHGSDHRDTQHGSGRTGADRSRKVGERAEGIGPNHYQTMRGDAQAPL